MMDHAGKIAGAVMAVGAVVSAGWWAVTRADEVMRQADQVPVLEQGHFAQENRLRDLEGDAARTAQALEKVLKQQDQSATREQQQTVLMQEILREVRNGN